MIDSFVLPLRVKGFDNAHDLIVDATGAWIADVMGDEADDNARDIVRAVNAHNDLVEAVRATLEALNGRVHSRDALAALSLCRAAIAKAEAPAGEEP